MDITANLDMVEAFVLLSLLLVSVGGVSSTLCIFIKIGILDERLTYLSYY